MKYEALINKMFEVVSSSGSEFLCRCPWHPEGKKPNLYVNAVKGVYKCHSCGAKGHLRKVASQMPTSSPADIRMRLQTMNERTSNQQRVYPEAWLERFNHPHRYWEHRGLTPETVAAFNLGYDPINGVLTIPVRDPRGQLLGVITRRLDNLKPKYQYPKGFPINNHLYGAWKIKSQTKVALVEGPLDAVACWNARVPAVALFGTYISQRQVRVLHRLGIEQAVIFTDNDGPGRAAVDHITEMLRGTGILIGSVRWRRYWEAKDPGELTPPQIRKAFHSATVGNNVLGVIRTA